MLGNGQEWCLDWYAEKLAGGSVTNPTGAISGDLRVLRSGAFPAAECSFASRKGYSPFHSRNQGFRVALVNFE